MNKLSRAKTNLVSLSRHGAFLATSLVLSANSVMALGADQVQVDQSDKGLGFVIPTLSDVLTFIIRFFFVVAGVAALIYLLWGALAWVISGGDKAGVEKARDKIVAAIVGVLLIVVVVAIVATLENVVFKKELCFGLTCPIDLPVLLKPAGTT